MPALHTDNGARGTEAEMLVHAAIGFAGGGSGVSHGHVVREAAVTGTEHRHEVARTATWAVRVERPVCCRVLDPTQGTDAGDCGAAAGDRRRARGAVQVSSYRSEHQRARPAQGRRHVVWQRLGGRRSQRSGEVATELRLVAPPARRRGRERQVCVPDVRILARRRGGGEGHGWGFPVGVGDDLQQRAAGVADRLGRLGRVGHVRVEGQRDPVLLVGRVAGSPALEDQFSSADLAEFTTRCSLPPLNFTDFGNGQIPNRSKCQVPNTDCGEGTLDVSNEHMVAPQVPLQMWTVKRDAYLSWITQVDDDQDAAFVHSIIQLSELGRPRDRGSRFHPPQSRRRVHEGRCNELLMHMAYQ